MMLRNISFILLVIVPMSVMSNQALGDFKDFMINGVPASLPENMVKKANQDLVSIGMSLKSCKPASTTILNPLINRETSYTIKPSKSGCRLDIIVLDTWAYNCLLTEEEKTVLTGYIIARASKGADVFGDVSEGEKEIMYDKSICDVYSL